MENETIWDIAHLAHVELFTPKLEESVWFFTEVMGMSISETHRESVYLRAYDDYEHHSLVLTAHKHAGLGHIAWRTRSAAALQRRVQALERNGYKGTWTEDCIGHGPAYVFYSPSGHRTELYFETEKYISGPDDQSFLKNTASKFPARGVNVRRLDHLNILAKDVRAYRDFHQANLGGLLTETIVDNLDDLNPGAVWFAVNSKSYDIAVTADKLGMEGRLHHITYACNSREEILIAADIFMENGIHVETGPHKHAIQQTFFLYVHEPGGNRIEVANSTARLVLDPTFSPVVWTLEERKKGQAWGLATIDSFHTYGTPMPEDLIE